MIRLSAFNILFLIGISSIHVCNGINEHEAPVKEIFVPIVGNPTMSTEFFNTQLDESDAEYWRHNAQNYLKSVLTDPQKKMTSKKAKNIVYFLGDGMSLATVAATRMYLGGEAKQVSFEKFPHMGLSKTYCVDKQVADSACSATAYLSGVKANYGTMGISANVLRYNCNGQNDPEKRTTSIAKWAQDQCKVTGLVTTSKVTDATPGGLYSHIANRDWENDQEVRKAGCDPTKTIDIARQLVENEVSKNFKIVLAGGREHMRDVSMLDEELVPGKRGDKRDLIKEWVQSRSERGKTNYVWDKRGLKSLANDTEFVLGLFSDGHCPYNIEIVEKHLPKPTLSEMTEAALKHLQRLSNENGFFLFVEGARIDMAHHDNYARIALDETREFAKAIEIVRNLTSIDDTLIVVTADHSHTLTYNGYSKRGSDILGLSDKKDLDQLPYTILSYANGQGYYDTFHTNGSRKDLTSVDFTDPKHRYPATLPLKDETHGGEDVGVYASGPESYMFIGNYEQSYIPMLIAHASKIGPFAEDAKCPSSTPGMLANVFILLASLSLATIIEL